MLPAPQKANTQHQNLPFAVPFLLKVLTVEVGAEPLRFQELKALVGSVLCEAMDECRSDLGIWRAVGPGEA